MYHTLGFKVAICLSYLGSNEPHNIPCIIRWALKWPFACHTSAPMSHIISRVSYAGLKGTICLSYLGSNEPHNIPCNYHTLGFKGAICLSYLGSNEPHNIPCNYHTLGFKGAICLSYLGSNEPHNIPCIIRWALKGSFACHTSAPMSHIISRVSYAGL